MSAHVDCHCQCIDTKEGRAYVIDSALDENTLGWIDEFRLSLPLDSKRPTVDRRFFADGPPGPNLHTDVSPPLHPNRPMSHILETAIQRAIAATFQDGGADESCSHQPQLACHVFRYQRFLEYARVGSKLDPHTDGTKICDDTQLTSTHTLLLYLTDCQVGGETILMTQCSKELPQPPLNDNNNNKYANVPLVLYATQPRRGRILLFSHLTPHAGAAVVSSPKICLRAEVCIYAQEAKTNDANSS